MSESENILTIIEPRIIPYDGPKSKKNQKSLSEKRQQHKEVMNLKNEIGKLKDSWLEIMFNCGKYNKGMLTYTLHDVKQEDYGWSCRVYAPWSLTLEELEKLTPAIQNGLKCRFTFKIPEHMQFAMAKIIYPNKVKCNEIPFKPHQVKPWQLFAGVDVAGDPIIFDVNKTPHVLLAGQTRYGKNGSLDHMLTSLIYSCSDKEIELYLLQCAKNDLIKYEDCKQVKCSIVGDLNKMLSALKYVLKEIDNRLELMKDMIKKLKGDNIFHYNKLNPKNKLPYTYVVVDEIMVLKLKSTDKRQQKCKDEILDCLARIAEFGGSVGVTYIACHQKPEEKLMPTFLKNMSLIRICFGFKDAICSQIVLGNDLAVGLPPRRAYYSVDGEFNMLYTTNLAKENNESRIGDYIKYAYAPGHKTIFDEPGAPQTKHTYTIKNEGKAPITFDKLEEKQELHTDKIPGYVPYDPNKKANAVKVDYLNMESSKPVKGGKAKNAD